jgi:hypothetical protein
MESFEQPGKLNGCVELYTTEWLKDELFGEGGFSRRLSVPLALVAGTIVRVCAIEQQRGLIAQRARDEKKFSLHKPSDSSE